MQVEKQMGEELLDTIADAIRFRHLELIEDGVLDSDKRMKDHEIKDLFKQHYTLVDKLWRSHEMRREKALAYSILQGDDLGTQFLAKTLMDMDRIEYEEKMAKIYEEKHEESKK